MNIIIVQIFDAKVYYCHENVYLIFEGRKFVKNIFVVKRD